MTIREYVHGGLKERLERLIELGAPQVMIEAQKMMVDNPKIGGDNELLDAVISTKEIKKGRGGKEYILFNDMICFFPKAKYGMYISRKGG